MSRTDKLVNVAVGVGVVIGIGCATILASKPTVAFAPGITKQVCYYTEKGDGAYLPAGMTRVSYASCP